MKSIKMQNKCDLWSFLRSPIKIWFSLWWVDRTFLFCLWFQDVRCSVAVKQSQRSAEWRSNLLQEEYLKYCYLILNPLSKFTKRNRFNQKMTSFILKETDLENSFDQLLSSWLGFYHIISWMDTFNFYWSENTLKQFLGLFYKLCRLFLSEVIIHTF